MEESSQFDGAFKKKAPVIPSRRRMARLAADEEDPDSSVTTAGTPEAGAKKSGWGDSPGGEAPQPPPPPAGRRRRGAADADAEETAVESTQGRHVTHDLEEDDGTTAFIPNLVDEHEDMAKQVAAAPTLQPSRVPTIDELDAEIDNALPSAAEIGVDLSVLQSFLTPKEYVAEEDVEWKIDLELQVRARTASAFRIARVKSRLPSNLTRVGALSPPHISAPFQNPARR